MNILNIIISTTILLSAITVIHEIGHFICARIFSRAIDEFCIGCGPIIFRKGVFVLRLIPFLGYNTIELDINDSDIKKLKENLLILSSGYIATSILAIFIYPFSNIISISLLIGIIADYLLSNDNDGKLIVCTLKNIIHKQSK